MARVFLNALKQTGIFLVALLLMAVYGPAVFAGSAPTANFQVTIGAGNVPTATWSAPWANSCTASGSWSGTKATSGTQVLPAITSTAAYTLRCDGVTASVTEAVLTWLAPTQYTDGTALSAADLTAFRVYRGTSSTSLSRIAEVPGTARTYTATGLAAGTHYFAVTAVITSGTESAFSGIGSKTASAGTAITDTQSVTVRVAQPPVLTVQQTTAYRMRTSVDGFEFVALGTVPLGTACDERDVAGYHMVQRANVTLANRFDTLPLVVFAKCG